MKNISSSTAAQTLPTSSELTSKHWTYDVFLSFSEDDRNNFIGYLYCALVKDGIRTFTDKNALSRGGRIGDELLNAIRGSNISIVVFSKSYASSRWTLEKLVEILHCIKTGNHTLLPVFYHVDPSDVRNQTGTFTEAFARYEKLIPEDMERIKRWRAALTEAANYPGWNLDSFANGYYSTLSSLVLLDEFSNWILPLFGSAR
ncbi:hypothetical protein F2P56_032878 [Juglans regia]|uniref:ADP-ribosyl cyclase/cyclic ADP-ribose hydrolase n=2 Tax=Juglans regia TaxID=51240 RepID=A0A2I4EHQ3_JUGRE|nr:disease resistance protein RPV1-like [Juglans regia]KAF5447319.1 hypothetical protein F2P56_032878 [Juglans regia]